jgi:hypothetical protein
MAQKIKRYQFTYTFVCEKDCDPAETLDQEFYDITSNNDNISDYGKIEEIK